MVSGIGASPGISMGTALLFKEEPIVLPKASADDSQYQLNELEKAIYTSKAELEKIRDLTLNNLGKEKAQIFESHLMVLEDPELIKQTKDLIEKSNQFASTALDSVAKGFIAIFDSMDDPYLKERAADIKDVTNRIIRHLLHIPIVDLGTLDSEVILITEDLTPSQTATMNREMVLGFITDMGGKTSHSAIMARTLEIPAVVGTREASNKIKSGDFIIIDGATGEIVINPDDMIKEEYLEKKRQLENDRKELENLKGIPSSTKDNHTVVLAGNIGTPQDLDSLTRNDAEAVGLYRTEFVFMDRNEMPSEEEQFEAYKKVLENLGDKECIIRTLDIGGDKKLSYLQVGEEMNPFLGYRAIRICLQDKELFKTQLRALLRASQFGKLGIMFPMISNLEEILAAKEILAEAKKELLEKGVSNLVDPKIGIMIEVPSAAMITDILADHVDFFSIGTNDLTQYTCAVDRMNEKIEHLYDPFNPGLLRLIHMTIKNARDKNIMPAMCGSMAHIPEIVPFLLGCGLHEFSMSPMHILPTRKLIRNLEFKVCQELVQEILKMGSRDQIQNRLEKFLIDSDIRL